MNTLLATTQFSPLTGPSPIGDAVAGLGLDLHAREEVEVAIALPALPALLGAARSAPGDGLHPLEVRLALSPSLEARVIEWRSEHHPQVFLVDCDPFAGLGTELRSPEEAAGVTLILAAAVAEMVDRLEPPIGLVHAFGEAGGLVSLVLASRGLACESVFTPDPRVVPGAMPPASVLNDLAQRLGIAFPVLPDSGAPAEEIPVAAAARVVSLDALQIGTAGASFTASQRPVIGLAGLPPETALGLAGRILAGSGAVVLTPPTEDADAPDAAAQWKALEMSCPGRARVLPSHDAELASAAEPSCDILVLGPHAPAAPEGGAGLAGSAAGNGTFIVRAGPPEGNAFRYFRHDESAIWTALMRAMDAFRAAASQPASADAGAGADAGAEASGAAPFVERCHEAYRASVTAALAVAPL